MASDELVAKVRAVEEELDEILQERRVALGRPMRGVERDRLCHQFDRQEARLRERIEAVRAQIEQSSERG